MIFRLYVRFSELTTGNTKNILLKVNSSSAFSTDPCGLVYVIRYTDSSFSVLNMSVQFFSKVTVITKLHFYCQQMLMSQNSQIHHSCSFGQGEPKRRVQPFSQVGFGWRWQWWWCLQLWWSLAASSSLTFKPMMVQECSQYLYYEAVRSLICFGAKFVFSVAILLVVELHHFKLLG